METPRRMQEGIMMAVCGALLLVLMVATRISNETLDEHTRRLASMRREAFDYAVQCSRTKSLMSYDDITWVIVPQNSIRLRTLDGVVELSGFASIADSTVYLTQSASEQFWLVVHESLHMLGYIGHPDHPFRTCGARPEDNLSQT